jgi:hypothetical protein
LGVKRTLLHAHSCDRREVRPGLKTAKIGRSYFACRPVGSFWGPPPAADQTLQLAGANAAMFGRPITRSGHAQIAVVNCSEKAHTSSSHQTQGLTNAG